MGITDYGTQTQTFDFGEPADAENFNILNYKLHQEGIYEGGTLSYVDTNTVAVSALTCYITDPSTGNGVRIETAAAVNVDVTTTNVYIILRFAWDNVTANYMDFIATDWASVVDGDLIVGKVEYSGSTLRSVFDYTRRTVALVSQLVSDNLELKVQSQNPPASTVYVNSGTIRGVNGLISVSAGNSGTISSTTLGRNDIVWIDEAGAIQVTEGVDSGTPVTPDYGAKFVIAEIQRGASRTTIDGSEIISVLPVNSQSLYGLTLSTTGTGASYVGFDPSISANLSATTVQAAIDEIVSDLASTTGSNGATLIGVKDSGAHFSGTTVEAVLAEIVTGTSFASVDINSGAIDGTTIGSTSRSSGKFTTLDANGNVILGNATTDTQTVTGVWTQTLPDNSAAALTISDSVYDYIKIVSTTGSQKMYFGTSVYVDYTANSITIGSIGTVQITGNLTIGDASGDTVTINSASWTLSNSPTITGTWANLGTVTTVDINGGSIDGTAIGAASASTGKFTTLSITSMGQNWTNAGRTIANLGTVTGGTIGNVSINNATHISSSTGYQATVAISQDSSDLLWSDLFSMISPYLTTGVLTICWALSIDSDTSPPISGAFLKKTSGTNIDIIGADGVTINKSISSSDGSTIDSNSGIVNYTTIRF